MSYAPRISRAILEIILTHSNKTEAIQLYLAATLLSENYYYYYIIIIYHYYHYFEVGADFFNFPVFFEY